MSSNVTSAINIFNKFIPELLAGDTFSVTTHEIELTTGNESAILLISNRGSGAQYLFGPLVVNTKKSFRAETNTSKKIINDNQIGKVICYKNPECFLNHTDESVIKKQIVNRVYSSTNKLPVDAYIALLESNSFVKNEIDCISYVSEIYNIVEQSFTFFSSGDNLSLGISYTPPENNISQKIVIATTFFKIDKNRNYNHGSF